ncbi:MAG TPA: UDP-glucose 4-epimerase GalE [Crocinitomix sp.]|nr:UDP-glucose 4-epimerase GalE [Crocinitomix sp.]
MNNKILVTGGAGYIGSHTVVELIDNGYLPIIVDDFRNSNPLVLDKLNEIVGQTVPFYNIDCTDKKKMDKVFAEHPDLMGVIHFAAYKAVGESVEKPLMYYQNNLGSLMVVLELMEAYKISNLVFSSSCTVYGEPKVVEVSEQTPIQEATSPYGDTKIVSEKIITNTVNASAQLKATLLRYFNPIGAHPSAKIGELPNGVPNNLLPYLTQTVNGIREVLTVFGGDYNTKDGTCIRDYIHVVDLAKAHVKALNWLDNQKLPVVESFNIGTEKGNTIMDVIKTFEKVNNLKVNYKIGERREGDVEQIYANTQKAKEVLNWSCEYSLDDALKHQWAWEKTLKK